MILKIFAVLDTKAKFFGNPWFDQETDLAIRNFSDAVNDGSNPNNMWYKHPEDFSLFSLGEFDNRTGEFIPALPSNLITASAVQSLNNGARNHEKPISDELRVLENSKGKQPA